MKRRMPAYALICVLALVLTACVGKADATQGIAVTITDDGCAVAVDTAPAGAVAFRLINNGSDVNEFEILAEDKLRIIGEKRT